MEAVSSRNDWRGRGGQREHRRPQEDSEPTRRLPEEIYQRRRIAAAAILLVIVALLIWAAVSCSGPKEENPAPAASSQTNSWAAPAPRDTPAPSDKNEGTKGEGKASAASEKNGAEGGDSAKDKSDKDDRSAKSEPGKKGDTAKDKDKGAAAKQGTDGRGCSLADLEVSAQTDQPSYARGEQPTFSMTVRNPSGSDCEVDLEASPLRFEVYDMATNARVWSDIDCNEPMEHGRSAFKAKEERHFEAIWSRTTSAPGQCAGRQPVRPGSYYLHAVVGDNPSAAQPFNISA